MNNEVVIAVENLGKCYRIQHQAERQRYTALRDVDVIADKAKSFLQKVKSGKVEKLKSGFDVSACQFFSLLDFEEVSVSAFQRFRF